MAAAPICMTCDIERTLIGIKPVRNRHDLQQYECPNCRDIFRLVVQRAPFDPDDLVFEEAPRQTGTR